MTRHERRLQELTIIASGATDFVYNRHAAALYIGNKLISVGINQKKTHPIQAKFGRNKDAIYLHAEIAAIVNALKVVALDDLRRAVLYVAKYSTNGHTLSKPCKGCQRAIMHFNIKDCIWTT